MRVFLIALVGICLASTASARTPKASLDQTEQSFGQWKLRCVDRQRHKDIAPGSDCEVYHSIQNTDGAIIVEIAFSSHPKSPDRLVTVVQVPRGTLLREPVKLDLFKEKPVLAQYVTCLEQGCIASASVFIKQSDEALPIGKATFRRHTGEILEVVIPTDGLRSALLHLNKGDV